MLPGLILMTGIWHIPVSPRSEALDRMTDGRNSMSVRETRFSARWPRQFVALCLAMAALVATPLAFRERATADFLAALGRTPGIEQGTASGSYYGAFWFDLALSVALVVIALAMRWRPGRSWYGAAVLATAFAAVSGMWALWGHQPEVRSELPTNLLAAALVVLAGLALIGSILGWLAAEANSPPTLPMDPPVPPGHQAG